MSRLREALGKGGFTFTGEIGPPKGTNIAPVLHEAEEFLKDCVVAVNVTDIQTAVMRMSSLPVCKMLLDRGIEPVLQMVTRDRNRLALQSDLLGAAALGIENVLALTGDHIVMGDHQGAKGVWDLDSVGLLDAMTKLESGTDLGLTMKGEPNALDGVPTFFKGCVVAPCTEEVEPQIIKLEKKVAAGAQFVQTQAVYDPRAFEAFMKRIAHVKVPVLVGIVLLKNAGMAKYMNKNVPGVRVPKRIVDRLAAADKKDVRKVSVEVAGELIREMKGMCAGAHIMPLGWDKEIPRVIEASGVK
ncbi:MAG: methylenetetrahydrofolate reductase [Deltaproteobacteria bacterium]|nr:methylenetetrahydrofolate reductase [Deltaproteobacteria bacterium]